MAMPRGEADRLVAPYLERLNGIILDAWGGLARYRRDLPIMSRRSRASLVRDFMLENALREFGNVRGVVPLSRGGRFFLVFGGRLFVQLKKFNRRGRPSNYLTAQAKSIIDQRQTELFEEYQNITFATAGYRLNRIETQIAEVAVACHEGQEELWVLDMPSEPSGGQPPTPRSITPPPPPLSRIVHRQPDAPQRQVRRGDG
jgi:hypothetical protein